eukprot:scaffold40750_cov168-Amphora_coffeaeformis.AAC.1
MNVNGDLNHRIEVYLWVCPYAMQPRLSFGMMVTTLDNKTPLRRTISRASFPFTNHLPSTSMGSTRMRIPRPCSSSAEPSRNIKEAVMTVTFRESVFVIFAVIFLVTPPVEARAYMSIC